MEYIQNWIYLLFFCPLKQTLCQYFLLSTVCLVPVLKSHLLYCIYFVSSTTVSNQSLSSMHSTLLMSPKSYILTLNTLIQVFINTQLFLNAVLNFQVIISDIFIVKMDYFLAMFAYKNLLCGIRSKITPHAW